MIYTKSRQAQAHAVARNSRTRYMRTRLMVNGWHFMRNWKDRLLHAVELDGRSDRAISLAAGLGPNFLNQLRNSDKEPGIEHVHMLARELRLSMYTLFTGLEATPEDEEFLALWQAATPIERTALKALLLDRYDGRR